MSAFDLNEGKRSCVETCSVCLEEFDGTEPVTLRCGHSFHATCVLEWFRRSGSCPICRDTVDQEERDSRVNMVAQFKLKKSLSRRRDAPRRLKTLVRMHKQKMDRLREARRSFRQWKATDEGKKFKELQKKHDRLRSKTWKWHRFQSRRCVERQIALYPVVPLVMPVKKKKKQR